MNKLTMHTASMKWMMGLGSLALALGLASGQSAKSTKTDAEIKQAIIAESIARYKGSCPCPYNADRAGRRCGARSAYTRPGGASPLCYEKDVTQKMVGRLSEETPAVICRRNISVEVPYTLSRQATLGERPPAHQR